MSLLNQNIMMQAVISSHFQQSYQSYNYSTGVNFSLKYPAKANSSHSHSKSGLQSQNNQTTAKSIT